MTGAAFDFTPLFAPGLPPAAARWNGRVKFDFTGGNNDPDRLPLEGLIAAAESALRREGRKLAIYGVDNGPQGYRPLREFLVGKLKADAGIACTADDIVLTSGSNHGLDLVNATFLTRGDTVIVEEDCYQSAINRFNRIGTNTVGIPLDHDGMRMDALSNALDDLKRKGVRPKYIYTIPTVQNPTATVLPLERRQEMLRLAHAHGVLIFEDDCYSDLTWSGERPPAIFALSERGGVIHVGSFSKTIAPALRVGYVVAPWDVMSRMLALKTDAGSGALEQMVLAEYCTRNFTKHVPELRRGLRAKLETLMEALREHFGAAVEFDEPKGGIFLWIKLPDGVDTMKLYESALVKGVAINPGQQWSVNKEHSRSRLRLCFASSSHEEIHEGIAALAEVCRRDFGVSTTVSVPKS
ncbi:MAG TPA: PLP-dependent aminotransferase family protein [Burkholderiales bacterium]|nr:PLP-dependent aminotransferase family protein [Burkholderiales bacterium]